MPAGGGPCLREAASLGAQVTGLGIMSGGPEREVGVASRDHFLIGWGSPGAKEAPSSRNLNVGPTPGPGGEQGSLENREDGKCRRGHGPEWT